MQKPITLHAVVTLGALAGLMFYNAAAFAQPMPIRLNVVVHDDVPASQRKDLEAKYLQPWVKEMETFSGRRVELRLTENVAGISDADYRVENRKPLWNLLLHHNAQVWGENNSEWNYRLDKTLLLVSGSVPAQDPEQSELLGEGLIRNSAGWASLKTFAAAGHELGHMFGATHENAEVLFNGWFCETYTYPYRQALRSNCYRYSDLNRQTINAYLSEAP